MIAVTIKITTPSGDVFNETAHGNTPRTAAAAAAGLARSYELDGCKTAISRPSRDA